MDDISTQIRRAAAVAEDILGEGSRDEDTLRVAAEMASDETGIHPTNILMALRKAA